MTQSEQLRAALRGQRAAVGLGASIPSSLTAEVAAAAGADYVVVDQQHRAVDPAELVAMLQASNSATRCRSFRVARSDPWLLGDALDLGAAGVIVPLVNDAAQAARAVSACRYAPRGERSYGVSRRRAGARPAGG